MEERDDFQSAITCYQKCLDLIKTFDPKYEKEEASKMHYWLGNANRKVNKNDLAIQVSLNRILSG